jgi:hypothetical protein
LPIPLFSENRAVCTAICSEVGIMIRSFVVRCARRGEMRTRPEELFFVHRCPRPASSAIMRRMRQSWADRETGDA